MADQIARRDNGAQSIRCPGRPGALRRGALTLLARAPRQDRVHPVLSLLNTRHNASSELGELSGLSTRSIFLQGPIQRCDRIPDTLVIHTIARDNHELYGLFGVEFDHRKVGRCKLSADHPL